MNTKTCKAVAIFACTVLCSCSKKEERWGGSSGSQALPSEKPLRLCFGLQGDTYTGAFNPTTARPQFVILWKAQRKGNSSWGSDNKISEIHGNRISVSFSEKAVYALQPDYSIKRLTLTPVEVDQILQSFMTSTGVVESIPFDALWDKKILPYLPVVEDPTWSPPAFPKKP